MQTILVLVLDGIMDSSLAITLDTLKTGNGFLSDGGRKSAVRVLTAGQTRTLRTGAGLRMTTDMTFAEQRRCALRPDWVILPGAGLMSEAEITARFAQKDGIGLMRVLREMSAAGVKLAASCSSVFLLAEAGLLAGRTVTMTWWLAAVFRARYPDVRLDETKMLARDGQFLTAGSALSQLDLALSVITETMGSSVAQLCSRYMLIDQRPSQARYMIKAHSQNMDTTVVAAEQWVDGNLSVPISVAALSSRLALSPRTLARRIQAATGVSPVKFIQRRKLQHAVHLIETTSMPIDVIAGKIGYQDGTALRKLIRREFGTTPGGLR